MALAQINQSSQINLASMKTEVFVKNQWAGQWTHKPYFQVMNVYQMAAPSTGSATIKIRYGKGIWEDLQEMISAAVMQSFKWMYVQVRGYIASEEIILFTGVVPAEKFFILGTHGGFKTADQVIVADSLESLLDTRLEFAVSLRDTTQVKIEWIPEFNQRHRYGGQVMGNRCQYAQAVDRGDGTMINIYLFGGSDTWNNFQIIQYLLTLYQQNNGPKFRISENSPVVEALESIIGIYDFSQTTLRAALNTLINRARGLSWRYELRDDNTVELIPFSMLDADIKIGEVTMPANANSVDMSEDVWSNQVAVNTEIISDGSAVYDKIIVRGAKIKSCFTVRYSDGTLEKAWTDTAETSEEVLFKEAAKYSTGYDALDDYQKAELNDAYRTSDKFAKVFTTFRVPADWDWMVGSDIVNPVIDNKGQLDTTTQGPYYNQDKRLLAFLPFLQGVDYSQSDSVDKNKDNSEPDYRPAFVLVTNSDGQYEYVEKHKPGAHVKVCDREMAIEVKFSPQYFAAAGHLSDAEPLYYATSYIDSYGVDYEDYIATVFMETDSFCSVSHVIGVSENARTLVIDIPQAELWYVLPSTVIDIDDDGSLITYGGSSNIIRDDTSKLQAVLDSAAAWYSRIHDKAVITFEDTVIGFEIGTLITGIGTTGNSAGSVVTSRMWDFQQAVPKTIIKTDNAEIDITILPFDSTVNISSPKAAARKIEKISHEIRELKSHVNRAPIRYGFSGLESEATELVYVCKLVQVVGSSEVYGPHLQVYKQTPSFVSGEGLSWSNSGSILIAYPHPSVSASVYAELENQMFLCHVIDDYIVLDLQPWSIY